MADARSGRATYDGCLVWYRISGSGPPLVLIRQNRVPKNDQQLALFAGRFTAIQVTPVGFGASDRPVGYRPPGGIAPSILAALDQEGIDRFVVRGYSQGGAMAAVVAQATRRVCAMIADGSPVIGVPTPGTLRRLDKEPRLPVGAHAFWHYYAGFEWDRELTTMECTKIVYFGSEDRSTASQVRRSRERLIACGVDVFEFSSLDHRTCGSGTDAERRVVPTLLDALDAALPSGW
ncbi:alpha/beta fold hydrolase [Phytoactinopolyspora halotolerans]|uniref:Alpha/beta hydrolase n=1 Tax=Phytoactinopolyspora halotolerans TaxID=1981512 RepID=A0A6L9SB56_9ACTN|nr:alpha/beta hydrolase [Phytoactinopolyspora halotolerans]NEE02283.1 alpha/beta hydrolase [Phytoactinopolyspora halotolerans]